MNPEFDQSKMASRLFDDRKECICGGRLQKGLTNNGKPAWFEEVVDHGTGELVMVNHWAVCRRPEEARELYGAPSDGTRQGKCPRCMGGGAIVFSGGGATCAACGWTSVPVVPPSRRRPRGYRRRHPSARSRMGRG